MDQGSNKNHSPAYNFTPTVTKFCVMWEGLSLPHDTKFGNCRCKIVDSRSFHSWSLIHGLRWTGLIKVGPGAAYMRQWTSSSLVQIMACRLLGAKPLPEPMLSYCQLDSVKYESEFYHFQWRKCNWKCCLPKWRPISPRGGDELMSFAS